MKVLRSKCLRQHLHLERDHHEEVVAVDQNQDQEPVAPYL